MYTWHVSLENIFKALSLDSRLAKYRYVSCFFGALFFDISHSNPTTATANERSQFDSLYNKSIRLLLIHQYTARAEWVECKGNWNCLWEKHNSASNSTICWAYSLIFFSSSSRLFSRYIVLCALASLEKEWSSRNRGNMSGEEEKKLTVASHSHQATKENGNEPKLSWQSRTRTRTHFRFCEMDEKLLNGKIGDFLIVGNHRTSSLARLWNSNLRQVLLLV